MSSSLYWRPPEPEGKSFGYDLKFTLREYFGGGMLSEWTILGERDVPFLRGLIAGAGKEEEVAKEARFLIDKIEKYGHVEVRERS